MSYGFVIFIAIISAVCLPLLDAWINVTNRKMKKLHENTVNCYVNPSMLFFMGIIILFRGQVQSTWDLLTIEMTWYYFFLYTVFGTLTMVNQTLRFVAMQYGEPAKLSQYTYLTTPYQLMYDIFIFKVNMMPL